MNAPERLKIAQGKWLGLIFFGAKDPFPIIDELYRAEYVYIRSLYIDGDLCLDCCTQATQHSARNYVARVNHYVYGG